jgi:hypothetical protein
MKKLLTVLSIGACVCFFHNSTQAGKIKNFILDKSRTYTIKVAGSKFGTTTVMFPTAIGSVQGANVTDNPGENAGFVFQHNKGSYFFSVLAQKTETKGSLNVVFNHNIYVLRLVTVPEKESFSSVTFQSSDQIYSDTATGGSVTPTIIRDIIEKARMYSVLQTKYPEYYENVERTVQNRLFQYTGYVINLKTIYRFKADDTVVFQIVIKNTTDKTLSYDPHLIAVRLNSRLYYSSVSVASGKIPPNGESPIWFAVTGTPNGGRNEMKADNDWEVLLTATEAGKKVSMLDINSQILEKEQKIKESINIINARLNSTNLSNEEINILSKRLETLNNKLKELNSYKNINLK